MKNNLIYCLNLWASDGNKTVVDVSKVTLGEIERIIAGFNRDMKTFGLEFTGISYEWVDLSINRKDSRTMGNSLIFDSFEVHEVVCDSEDFCERIDMYDESMKEVLRKNAKEVFWTIYGHVPSDCTNNFYPDTHVALIDIQSKDKALEIFSFLQTMLNVYRHYLGFENNSKKEIPAIIKN